MAPLDYAGVASKLLARANELLPEWLPGGKKQGQYYCCADITGGHGDSFKVNLESGLWSDFASPDNTGKDFIDLYGKIHGISNHDSALQLMEKYLGYTPQNNQSITPRPQSPSQPSTPPITIETKAIQKQEPAPITIQKPPLGTKLPNFTRGGNEPSTIWTYKDQQDETLFHIARYDKPDKSKDFLPFVWEGKRWINKHYPAPRPLYGLEILQKRPKFPILLVEGEKACEAIKSVFGDIYNCMTWPGGSMATKKVDFSPIYGKQILLWPDADEPGMKAMQLIALELNKHCQLVKILNPFTEPNNKSGGWDAADAIADGWSQKDTISWGKERVIIFKADSVTPEQSSPEYIPKPKDEPEKPIVQVENITNQAEVSISQTARWLEIGLACSSKGVPVYNEDNVLRIFERDEFFKDFIWWDSFHKKYFTSWLQIGQKGDVREWTDVDLIKMTTHLQRKWGLSKINNQQIDRAASEYAHQHPRNEPLDWLKSLTWDGKRRLEEVLNLGFGVPHDSFVFDISKNFFISMVARICNPGCQVDTMLILEGKQGSFKSSSLRVLGGKWYASCRANIGTANFYNAIQGKWLIEIAEMDSFSKAEISAVKDMLTTPIDRFKIPYKKYSEDFPRLCVFVGTTNERTYLQDLTGARRFWPITIRFIDMQWLKDNREQIFAEAYARYNQGERWHEVNKKQIESEQEKRRQEDPWEAIIHEYIEPKQDIGVVMLDILNECLHMPTDKQDMKALKRVAKILHFFGWENKNERGADGKVHKIWMPEQYIQDKQD